jgi:hypothetical protein
MSNNGRIALFCILLSLPHVTVDAQNLSADARRIADDALFLSPEYTVPVRNRSGDPMAVAADFNEDGLIDVALLTVAADPRFDATQQALSETSRLYDSSAIRPLFLLETLFQLSDTIVTVELGRQVILDELSLVYLSGDTDPAVRVAFRSSSGTTDHLVSFSRDGRANRLRLSDSPSEFGELADLDGDQTLEAVAARRVPEAGRGYETFLELYRLSDRGYTRVAGFAVVRQLAAFLEEVQLHVLNGEWEAVVEHIAAPEGLTTLDILSRTFELIEVNGEPPSDSMASSVPTPIDEVIGMQLSDNPFPVPFRGQAISVPFRIRCCGEEIRVYNAMLQMEANPFTGRRFSFLTELESGQ